MSRNHHRAQQKSRGHSQKFHGHSQKSRGAKKKKRCIARCVLTTNERYFDKKFVRFDKKCYLCTAIKTKNE